MDLDGNGTIGIDELELPLISFKLCKNRKECKQIMASIDQNNDQKIQFNEFVELIKNAENYCKIKEMRKHW